MPVEIAPNRIELDKLDGGFSPDTPEASLPMNASPDVLNLLPEPSTGSPEARKGFTRLSAGRIAALSAHYVKNLYYYETIDSGTRKRYLVAILSNGLAAADNVRIYVYDLVNDTFTRVDTAGRTWTNPKSPHWSFVVGGVYFGGVRGDAIYSWHPTDGWKADPTALSSPKTWVDAVNDSVNTATELARDYAFKKRHKVVFSGENYSTLRDIRFDAWESGEQYALGDRISRKTVWASTSSYWKSFECTRTHTATTANAPGTGANWTTYWKKIRLPNIKDADGDLNDTWTFAGNGVKSSVGNFYGDRAFIRRDNEDDRSKLQYSAPLTLEKDVAIPDAEWDPTDWAAIDDIDGEGGGWLPFTGGRGDAIRGLWDLGNYLIVSKRWGSWVLAGRSEASWAVRKLGSYGVVALNCLTELDGLAYGLSHTGTLWVTDGTSQREVPGYEKAKEFIKERIDRLLQAGSGDDEHWMPSILEYDSRIFVLLPDQEGAGSPDDITLVYDPKTESWWKTDLPMLAATTGAKNRARRLYFAPPQRGSFNPIVFEYTDDPGNLAYTDDDQAGGASTLTDAIPWRYRSAWFTFGLFRTERRIRRAWALVKTAVSVTVKGFRDFDTDAEYTKVRAATSGESATYVEGEALGRAAHSTALEVSGTAATGGPAIIGLGVDTQPVRERFHRN